ncbi:MAG TPA: extracellular solute-binding protein [Candidatus Baltobacteraceae bacterium]|nr:extracellular solute-binding protein [Candidatus Baltobacteraceae bacterium]
MNGETIICAAMFLAASIPVAAQAPGIVDVLYAGSLVTPMEGPVKSALRAQGIDFQGQPGGSKALANLIAAGVKTPDVFISVNPALVKGLGKRVAHAVTFGSTSLGIGWSRMSPSAQMFARVANGSMPLLEALETPGLKIGRTDPQIDPKGQYTIEAMQLFAGPQSEQRILGSDENNAQVFPEEDLLARVDAGEVDVGFFYRTEAVARGLRFIPLPGKAALSDKITYTLAVMADAPHPAQAERFADFMLRGEGKRILQKAGIDYLDLQKTSL